jgi:branched-chain amino acid transport system substrate-binding protein
MYPSLRYADNSREPQERELGTLLPGITVNTIRRNAIRQQMQMMRFNGERWERFGPIIGGEIDGR